MPLVVTVAVLIVVVAADGQRREIIDRVRRIVAQDRVPVIDRFFAPPVTVPLNVAVEAVSVVSLPSVTAPEYVCGPVSPVETEPAFRAIAAAVTSRLDSGVEWPI